MQNKHPKIILLFGVFDLLHNGHKYVINEASKLNGVLHISLATDEFVLNYKNKKPTNNFIERKTKILNDFPEIVIHIGDSTIGEWSIFKEITPDIIVFGYDQTDLLNAVNSCIKNLGIKSKVVVLPSHKPDIYKTSLLS